MRGCDGRQYDAASRHYVLRRLGWAGEADDDGALAAMTAARDALDKQIGRLAK